MAQVTPEAIARYDSCLTVLRQLKEVSARREVTERDILSALLAANREHLSEYPANEADQQNLVSTVTSRCETQPGHSILHGWLADFVTALNQYEVAKRTGAADQIPALENNLAELEALLMKCLQGYIFVNGIIRDEFNDTILHRFGEEALASIDELTNAGEADARYWRGFFDKFLFGFVAQAYDQVMASDGYRLAREGSFLALRLPLDALTAGLTGTDKTIDKTRLQAAFESVPATPEGKKSAAWAAAYLGGLAEPIVTGKMVKADCEFLGRMAAMDPAVTVAVGVFEEGKPLEDEDGRPPESPAKAKAFLKNQVLALCLGGALALGINREDMARTLKGFSPKELDMVFSAAGSFQPVSMGYAYQLLLELALSGLMTDKSGDDAGKVQVRLFRQRRAARQAVEALAAQGLNRIRQKLFWEEDPTAQAWLLFKAKTAQELIDSLKLSNIEPPLISAIQQLWSRMQFRSEVVALINLPLVAKSSPNLQAKVAEMLGKFGVTRPE